MTYEQRGMIGQICMVTGANRGIGRATAQGLADLGATVILVCRNRTKGELAKNEIIDQSNNQNIELMITDLSVTQEIRKLVEAFSARYDRLDVLINNATGGFYEYEQSADKIEMNFALNYLAYFTLTNLMINSLKISSSARVINVSTESHRIGKIDLNDLFLKNDYNPITAYMQAKLANILNTYELDRKLVDSHISVNCLDPGTVDTQGLATIRDYARKIYGKSSTDPGVPIEEGAQNSIYLATATDVEGVSGKYFVDMKETESSEASYDQETAKKLWVISEELSGVTLEI